MDVGGFDWWRGAINGHSANCGQLVHGQHTGALSTIYLLIVSVILSISVPAYISH